MKRCLAALLAGLVPTLGWGKAPSPPSPQYAETTVCGPIREALAFWSWSRLAGPPDDSVAERLPNAHRLEHRTRDRRLLRGYRLASTAPGGETRGTVLVAQGNAMLADQLLRELQVFAQAGLESWVFDYRGYGSSGGTARLQAIVGDYLELQERMAGETGQAPALYGISFGGVVLLNVIGRGAAYARGVIDSSPARGTGFGCPHDFDPAGHFPREDARLLVIAGHRDTVVSLPQTEELLDLAVEHGGHALIREDFHHPFMDADPAIRDERMKLTRDYLLGRSVESSGSE